MASAYLDQRVAISGRIGRPGVYVCFVDESKKQLLLWRVGTNDAISVASSPSIIEKPLLVPGPGGELWLAWLEGNQVLVRTLAADGHSLCAVRAFSLPKTPYFLDPQQLLGSARGSSLDLVLYGWSRSGMIFAMNVGA